MTYKQRDLVRLKQPITLPDGQVLDHPVLIISCNDANSRENSFIAVMMTGHEKQDRFSFMINESMFEGRLNKQGGQFRMYILPLIRESDIDRFENRMKIPFFKILLEQIKERMFTTIE